MRRFFRVTRRRVLLAATFAAIVVLAGYGILLLLRDRPRFDEAAWGEAVEILREEVGEEAVDAGLFSVPRVKVSPPRKGSLAMHTYAGLTIFVRIDPSHSRLLCCETDWAVYSGKYTWKTAPLDRAQARHIARVVSYLSVVKASGSAEGGHAISSHYGARARVAPRARRGSAPPTVEIGASPSATGIRMGSIPPPGAIARMVAAGCCKRLMRRLAGADDLSWSSAPENLGPAVFDALDAACPPFSEADQKLVEVCVHRPPFLPRAETLAVIHRLKQPPLAPWLKRLPFVGRFFKAPRRPLDVGYPSNLAWAIETFTGKSPSDRVRLLAEAAGASTHDGRARFSFAARYLPEELTALCLREFHSLPQGIRWFPLLDYESHFGNEVEVAERALDDESAFVRVVALAAMHRLTGDERYLSELIATAEKAPPDTKAVRRAVTLVTERYPRAAYNDEIDAFVRRNAGSGDDWAVVRYLLKRGGDENIRFVISVFGGRLPLVDFPHGELAPMSWRVRAVRQIAERRVPQGVEALLDYASWPTPKGEEELRDEVFAALATTGDARALELLVRIAASAESNPLPPRRMPVRGAGGWVSFMHDLPDSATVLANSLEEIQARCADSPLDYVQGLGATARAQGRFPRRAIEVLADEYDDVQLQAFLAGERYLEVAGYIYAALCERRIRRDHDRE
ncbi:MAG: hypothetical protein ACYTAN_16965 [Planctomycetota bacterium]|jgi:hypothetical protein